MRGRALACLSILTLSICASAADSLESRAAQTFERIRNNPLELRAFLERMPKGADLHMHLDGAVYAETIIRSAAGDHLCVDRPTLTIQAACTTNAIPISNANADPDFYRTLVDAFSMRNFVPSAGVSGHDHFFAAFDRFIKVSRPAHLGVWFHELVSRAASQNEQYLEIMHTPDITQAARLVAQLPWTGDLPATRQALLARGLKESVERDRREFAAGDQARLALEHCATANRMSACQVNLRFLFQVLRGFPPGLVFAQALLGFELASTDPAVVGINFVMPEDWLLPMAEYHRQMQMLDYLHSVYPTVHISLHAGELAPGLVPPEGLQFHIREAVELGHAERIGHGVDVMYEHSPHQLLGEMSAAGVLVEINLTSNDVILGIKGRRHPLPIYRAAHVPVALSTDDEGVSRIDLTHEFQRAAEEFHLSYPDLKAMARSSLAHCFLPPAEKRSELRELDRRFRAFESAPHLP